MKKFLKYFSKPKIIELGSEFPYKDHVTFGDYSRPMLTAESIDLIISLTDLSPQEEAAIGDGQFEIFILETYLAPMVALRFGNVFSTDFSINLSKMDKGFVDAWLNSDNSTMTIYLLEGSDTTVQCVRYVTFNNMKYLKNLCRIQLRYSSGEIDMWIRTCNNRYTTQDIIRNANVHEVIPHVSSSL